MADVAKRSPRAVLISLWAGGGTRASESAQTELPIRQALEQYAREANGTIAIEISKRRDFPLILSRYPAEAERWVASQDGERPRRERVSVGLAMELLATTVNGSIQSYESGRALVEWACRLLSKGPPTEFERAVHLTSLAILQGAGDYYTFGIDEIPNKRAGHLDHAIARYPDEDRLKLARILTRYELRVIATDRLEPADLVPTMWYRPGWMARNGSAKRSTCCQRSTGRSSKTRRCSGAASFSFLPENSRARRRISAPRRSPRTRSWPTSPT